MIADSVADRRPSSRKRSSVIGFVVDPFRRRSIWYESNLEASWAYVLVAHPQVAEIREQQELSFSVNGAKRLHFFDFVVTTVCGRRDAYAIKHRASVDDKLKSMLSDAAEMVGDQFADRYLILDEHGLSKTMIANAREIIACAEDYDFEAQDFIVDALLNGNHEVTLAECDAIVGEGNRGSRAAMALLQKGKLSLKRHQRLAPETVLVNGYAF